MINLIHHGGKEGVSGSCHQLMLEGGKSLLVDCGLFQGAETSSVQEVIQGKDPNVISFPTKDILALMITHSHIDHAGRTLGFLPQAMKGSEPSAALLPLMLEDAFKLKDPYDGRIRTVQKTVTGESCNMVDYRRCWIHWL